MTIQQVLKNRGALHIINGHRYYTEKSVLCAMKKWAEEMLNEHSAKPPVIKAVCEQHLWQYGNDSDRGWNRCMKCGYEKQTVL